jgi:4a-hydroxytetrahydrobiopterin dehydratase
MLARVAKHSPLPEAEVAARAARLPNWALHAGKLRREWRFASFVEAFGFMTRVALLAEKLDHHPKWTNVDSRLSIELWTHDAGGLTALDFELAAAIDALEG